jgi:AcrR family transcriptional regulator
MAEEADLPGGSAGIRQQAGRRRRLPAEHRRALILEAAAQQFAAHGYAGASMTGVAATAGIAPSVIYDHFGSKRDLHLELLSQHARAMIEATTMPRAGESGEELVWRTTDAFFSFVEQHRYAWRMLFRDPPADEQIAAIHARIHQQGSAAIARLIHQAPALRLPPVIPRRQADEMVARAVKSSNDGLAAWWYEHPEVPKDQVVAVAVGLCWSGLARLTGALPEGGG